MNRIVIYRLGSLGDTVVALPCLHQVERAFPDAERVLLTNFPVHAKSPPLQAVLADNGLVHRYLAYPAGTRSLGALLRLALELRRLRAHTLVYLTPARGRLAAWRDLLYFRLACGIPRVVGVPVTADLQQHRVDADGLLERECERLARCVAPLGAVDLDRRDSWDLRLTPHESAAADEALGAIGDAPAIAVNMGGKFRQNDWGVERWHALMAALQARWGDHALMVVGGPEDAERAQALAARWPSPVVNLCGRLTPRASAAAMARAAVFVGHDSGPLHLAACMGVPCVGLFGDHHRPRKWHPWGRRHRLVHDLRGVQAIEVAQVQAAVDALLESARRAEPAASRQAAPGVQA